MSVRTYAIDDGEFVKVGVSTNPWARCLSMQTGNARPLTVVWTFPIGRRLERTIHAAARDWHVRGEWFDLRRAAAELEWPDFVTMLDEVTWQVCR